MKEYDLILMTLVIFTPVLFMLALVFVPRNNELIRWVTLAGTAVTLVLSLILFIDYYHDVFGRFLSDPTQGELVARAESMAQAADQAQATALSTTDLLASVPWIPQFNINYYLGVDGISMPLILLSTVLFFLSMLASWGIEKHVRGYCMLFLLLETGVLGTFFALDFFLFFVFWEVMLLPMYFLIGVWGGPRREYAAVKFFLYTMLGSVFILIAMLGFYFTDLRGVPGAPAAVGDKPVNTFSITALHRAGEEAFKLLRQQDQVHADLKKAQEENNADAEKKAATALAAIEKRQEDQPFFTRTFQIIMFLLLFVGFAIKVPVFPFHTWLPDAHVEAPTPISMILAGILLKLGGYGILRIAYPICPWAAEHLAWYLALFGVINIVYGAFAAMAQKDFKKLVAYSSISHMGYVILGIAVWSAGDRSQYWSWGMNGAMFQMIAHGISSAGMFFLVGVIYERAHHRDLDRFRGLNEPMPLYGGMSAIIFFAALGLPGLCGFVGEFFVVLATWNYDKVFAILAALTVVLTAGYILWTLQRVYLGTNPAYKDYPDLRLGEIITAVPLVVLAVVLGVFPGLLLTWMQPSVTGLVQRLANL